MSELTVHQVVTVTKYIFSRNRFPDTGSCSDIFTHTGCVRHVTCVTLPVKPLSHLYILMTTYFPHQVVDTFSAPLGGGNDFVTHWRCLQFQYGLWGHPSGKMDLMDLVFSTVFSKRLWCLVMVWADLWYCDMLPSLRSQDVHLETSKGRLSGLSSGSFRKGIEKETEWYPSPAYKSPPADFQCSGET